MTDDDALVIDCMELVSQGDPASALALLQSTDITHIGLQRAALLIMAFTVGGDGASERFAELRSQLHELAVVHGARDRQVVMSLETIATVEALTEGDPERADAIMSGSMLTAIDSAWCAICLTGQCVRGWVGGHDQVEFWSGMRHNFGIGGAA